MSNRKPNAVSRTEHGYSSSRLTLSEIISLLLNRDAAQRSSVTLTRNAKGETQIEVTVRTGDTTDVHSVSDAADQAIATYDRLRNRYPLANGMTSASPVKS